MKCFIVILLLCFVLVPTSPAQDPSTRPAGPVVGLSMIVTDKKDKGVNTIRKDQIRVFEEGTEQTILSLEPDERPVDLVLAVDSSGSLNRLFGSVLESAKLVIANRRPQDQIALVRFVSSSIIEKVQEFTTDNNALLKALDGSYLEKGISAVVDGLYVSVNYATEHNNSNDGRRKVVVIITDGEDRASHYKETDVLKQLRENGVQVFVLGLVVELDKDSGFVRVSPRDKAEKLLRNVAEESGGRVFFPKDKEELINATAEIILDLRAQFRIKYQSTRDASKTGFRKVEVKFVETQGDEKRKLVVPRGYYFGTPPKKKAEKKS